MSLYDHPLPSADYPAYRALRDEMCVLALPHLGQYYERQHSMRERTQRNYINTSYTDLATATAQLGNTPCHVQFIGRTSNGRWQWAWDDPPGIYPQEALRDALRLKAYGEAHGIEWLTRSGWPIELHGQDTALHALAVMLNNADGHAWDSAAPLLGKYLPAKGMDSVSMTVYFDSSVDNRKKNQEIVQKAINDLIQHSNLGEKRLPAIHAYLDSLPPDMRISLPDIPASSPDRTPAHISYFPESKTVFSAAQPWLDKHFLPLISFDLASLDAALGDVRLHLVKPVEPYSGYIGEENEAAHTDYCTSNWICFRLEDDGTYRFLADEDFFLDNISPDAAEYFAKVRNSYETLKRNYHELGFFGELNENKLPEFADLPDFLPFFWQGNWTSEEPPPAFTVGDNYDDWDEEAEIFYRGNRFVCIATTTGYDWGEGGADTVFLLYEPQSRLVLMTFDYS